jgi:FtsP/CotA-like multicopper oxidase with cupredoxin domain
VLEFILTDDPVTDDSFDPEPVSFPHVPATAGDAVFAPISLPDISTVQPRLTRTFVFGQHDDGWQINDEFMDCTRFRFTAQANTAERWIIQNDGGEWQHPIHIHLEEFRILSRNGVAVKAGNVQFSRKDVTALLPDERIEVLMRFRDNLGVYPFHCHNTVHEDHQMMLLFNVAPVGDTKRTP